MRKAFKHTGALMMAAVIGLSMIGAAYALWFEDLRFFAQVNTGTFDVDWSVEGPAEPIVSTDLGESWLVGQEIPADKEPDCRYGAGGDGIFDVGDGQSTTNDVNSNNGFEVILDDVYPYAGCQFLIDIHNVGTVPAHFQVLSVDCIVQGDPNTDCPTGDNAPLSVSIGPNSSWQGNAAGCPNADPAICPSGDVVAERYCNRLLAGEAGNTLEGLQLHTSNELWCEVRVTLNQVATEDTSYRYRVFIKSHQWNENQAEPQE